MAGEVRDHILLSHISVIQTGRPPGSRLFVSLSTYSTRRCHPKKQLSGARDVMRKVNTTFLDTTQYPVWYISVGAVLRYGLVSNFELRTSEINCGISLVYLPVYLCYFEIVLMQSMPAFKQYRSTLCCPVSICRPWWKISRKQNDQHYYISYLMLLDSFSVRHHHRAVDVINISLLCWIYGSYITGSKPIEVQTVTYQLHRETPTWTFPLCSFEGNNHSLWSGSGNTN